ncbi:MAG TPA: winged helix-turn-helix domain-containing protein, partial [Candidatus Tectomicrobia bacterium]|nr:winged helix-turn-helix domain-containing protein [Candidatus Tectomicrobia bacterium]
AALADSLDACLAILEALELDRSYLNLSPKGEPQLGRRGLYGDMGGGQRASVDELALLWVLNLSDGRHSLLDVAERSGLDLPRLHAAAAALGKHGLLRENPAAVRPHRGRGRRPGERWVSP